MQTPAALSSNMSMPEQKIEETLTVPVGSLESNHIRFLSDTIYRLCKPQQNGMIPASVLRLAERILIRVLQEEDKVIPLTLWNTVIRSAARNGQFKTAASLLDKMLRFHMQDPTLHPSPTDYQFSTVLYGCALSASDEALETAQSLVEKAEHTGRITIAMHNNLLLLYSNRAKRMYGAAAAAEDILLRLTAAAAADDTAVQPNNATYNLVLRAWTYTPEKNGASRADTILQILVNVGDPDVTAFGTVITAFGMRGQPQESARVLQQAVQVLNSHDHDLTGCWDAVCRAWSQQGNVEEIKRLLENVPANVRPSRARHRSYLEALLKNNSATQAEDHLINGMPEKIPPTQREFVILLKFFCSNRRAKKATHFLDIMTTLAEKRGFHCVPDAEHVAMVLATWRDAPSKMKKRVIRESIMEILDKAEKRRLLNTTCFEHAINTFCNMARGHDAADLLKRMEMLTDRGELHWDGFNAARLYTVVLAALHRAKNDEASQRVVSILQEMPRKGNRAVLGTTKAYATLLAGLVAIPGPTAAKITMGIFKEVRELDQNPGSKVKLDTVLFECVLWNLRLAEGPEHGLDAIRIMRLMIHMFRGGRAELEPTTRCYDWTIKAQMSGNLDGGLPLVREILDLYRHQAIKNLPSPETLVSMANRIEKTRGNIDCVDELLSLSEYIKTERTKHNPQQWKTRLST